MDAIQPPAASPNATPQIRSLLLCDLVDSTALVERVGDQRAAALMRRHDQLMRHLLQRHGGHEIDKSDGFLALFEHPTQAVACALDYQRELRALGNAEGWPLSARIGIHVGDVLLWENSPDDVAHGAKPVNVEGLAKPVAARLTQLALPGQILLSGVAYSLALRAQAQAMPERVRWCTHGRYRFKGVPAPMLVHEVGEPGIAPLRAPPSGDKAWRDVPLWRRPAVLAAQFVGLLAVAAIVAMATLRTPDAIAFRERDWVVVGSLNNLTDDPRFDGALETALRISLEQSRHVNVLPDLRVRDALQRMGRDPDNPVDRAIGSEVALREGARALLLPTVAEVGGRMRVSLEVVDPNNQRTVFADSADGAGAGSALVSVNEVSDRLRSRLGEAVQSIEQSSQSVEKVTSPNLDALRAYTLGTRALSVGKYGDARLHFEQALALDSSFALAHVALGRFYFWLGNGDEAHRHWQTAMTLQDRLSSREKLYLSTISALAEQKPDYPARWKSLFELYPDHHIAAHNYAFFMWRSNRFAEGISYAEHATIAQSVTRSQSTYILGILLLGKGQIDDAISTFQRASTYGRTDETSIYAAAALAAAKRYDEAQATLNLAPPASASQAIGRAALRAAIAADRSNWSQMEEIVREMPGAVADQARDEAAWLAKTLSVAVSHVTTDNDTSLNRAKEIVDEAASLLPRSSTLDRDHVALSALYAGLLALRSGDNSVAKLALESTAPYSDPAVLPALPNMHKAVSAALDASEGRHADAIQKLDPLLEGHELLLIHAILADSLAAVGHQRRAVQMLDWLTNQRGRAYAEYAGGQILQMENILQINLAMLRLAELQIGLDDAQAAAALSRFKAAWPHWQQIAGLVPRVREIETRLATP